MLAREGLGPNAPGTGAGLSPAPAGGPGAPSAMYPTMRKPKDMKDAKRSRR